MSSDTDAFVPSSEQLIRFIECSGESQNFDAKGPMKWDNAEQSASLSKDIAAFANSTDGGVLVIGKTAIEPGHFDYTGLTEEQASSFETTKVANWVNSRFSPPITLACHRHDYQGKTFIVITIQEFDDIPTFCIKSYPSQTDPRKLFLRESSIYIRNQNAESKPVGSVDEWRSLIGLATKKRRDEFMSIFDAMLKGRSFLDQPSDEDKFKIELQQVWDDLGLNQPEEKAKGAFWMSFSPMTYNSQRWPEPEMLDNQIRQHSIHVYHNYPTYQSRAHAMGWGISSDYQGERWALTYSGQFAFHREFYENNEACQGRYIGEEETPAGHWVAYQWSMSTFIEFFMFMARFVDAYDPGESVLCDLVVAPLQGKKLLSVSPSVRVSIGEPQPCHVKEFRYHQKVTVEELRTSWEDHCAKSMQMFYQLFPSEQWITIKTLRDWVERFKERQF